MGDSSGHSNDLQNKAKKIFVVLILIIFVIIICAIIIFKMYFRDLLFYPIKEMKPNEYKYKEVWIRHRNNYQPFEKSITPMDCYDRVDRKQNINGWHFNNFPGAKTVIFYHGNAGNISHRDYIIDICEQFQFNLLLIDYRGFGLSEGTYDQKSICIDGIAAYLYLRQFAKAKNIIIWGESLGGAVATHVASMYPCHCLILLSTFSSLDDIIYYSDYSKVLTMCGSFMAKYLVDCMPSKTKIKKVKCPIAIVHSKNDELINYKCSQIMYRAISHDNKKMITIDGGHSSPILDVTSLNKLLDFIQVDIRTCLVPDIIKISRNLRTVASRNFEGIFY